MDPRGSARTGASVREGGRVRLENDGVASSAVNEDWWAATLSGITDTVCLLSEMTEGLFRDRCPRIGPWKGCLDKIAQRWSTQVMDFDRYDMPAKIEYTHAKR